MSSTASSFHQNFGAGHKRGISEANVSPVTVGEGGRKYLNSNDSSPIESYADARQSLRAPPRSHNASPTSAYKSDYAKHTRAQITDSRRDQFDGPSRQSPIIPPTLHYNQPRSLTLTRSDSVTPSSTLSVHQQPHLNSHSPLTPPDLNTLKNSSTSHLRTLSKYAQSESSDDFSMTAPGPSVVGLKGRRQLKRTDSTRAAKGAVALSNGNGYGWAGRNWMDQQRQFLQAYEYLCHIGEAKEWIEDIIHKPIPPIVQLEEALRDGVTLAEVVQAFTPNRTLRIFRHPKLQFRHSDNVALFSDFLDEIALPELFRFELIDLYEKKNIPKVIYCIHALSWLLYRNGMVAFRIGNLVGQLQFEDHELEAMQKGLDKAGVHMPSFSGMGASFGAEPEPEPEPVESEEARIGRELRENEAIILDFQTQVRGAVTRLRLGQQMEELWDAEGMLIDLQSRVRGDWARQITDYRLNMQRFSTALQSAARGCIVRLRHRHEEVLWKKQSNQVMELQSLVRAKKSRDKVKYLKGRVRKEESGIRGFQSSIRGALERKRLHDQVENTLEAQAGVESLQAAARGMLQRKRRESERFELQECFNAIKTLQATTRGIATRSSLSSLTTTLQTNAGLWHVLQSVSRGTLLRQKIDAIRMQLVLHLPTIIALQALTRGYMLRQNMADIRLSLLDGETAIINLQSACRGYTLREARRAETNALKSQLPVVIALQTFMRGLMLRQKVYDLGDELQSTAPDIVQLQALSRAMLLRIEIGSILTQLEDDEQMIESLQAAARGKLVREKFVEKKRFFKENMEKVVKVQSFVRGKLQGQAYKSLTSGKNPPVGTVKGFVHLLNDSDFDFDEEVEFERLRKTVVQHVRQNELADQYITQLDIKIALLVKNKITLDEVVKHQKHFGGSVGSLLTNTEMASKDPFDLKALNKNSRRKLERYQALFFMLQTQPQYLARLFKKVREQATAEKECERVKHLVMGLFGYSQKRREEYYLLKVITRSVKEEVDSCHSLRDYLRGNFFWAKVFSAYIKSPRDRKYMRDLLGPIVKENIIENPELDLESDPMEIYLSAIENEQLRTGQRSHRRTDIPREEAIRDDETKRIFIAHLQDLRDIADQFFTALEDLLHKLPFGVRYIGQQMFQCLTLRFQDEEPGHILQIVGHWLWKSYLQPALLEPEKFGAVDRGLSQEQKRNLAEVSKVLSQAAASRLFGAENIFLQPLNSYISESIERLGEIWGTCTFLLTFLAQLC